MSLTFYPIHKLLLNKNGRSRIMSKIKDIQDCYNWDSFDLSISRSDLDLSYTKYEELVKELNDWGNIAKLSVDLWRDYDYYYKFPLDTRFTGEQCRERLNALGYICKDGTWESVRQPSEETVQLHVIMYCFYRLLSKEMDSKKDHCNTIICSFCDCEIVTDEDKCMHCGASLEDISKLQTSIDMRLNENILETKDVKGMAVYNCQNKICDKEEVKEKMNEVGYDDVKSDKGNIEETIENNLKAEHVETSDENRLQLNKLLTKDSNTSDDNVATLFDVGKEDMSINVTKRGNNTIKSSEMNKNVSKNTRLINDINCNRSDELTAKNSDESRSVLDKGSIYDRKYVSLTAMADNVKNINEENFIENIDIEPNKDLNIERNDEPWERIEIYDVNGVMIEGNIKYNELGVNDFKEDVMTQKWKCGGCEYSNEYIHANCIVCGKLFEDGTWYCGPCTKENKGVNKACDACGSINSKVNVRVNDGAARTINNEVISHEDACDKCGSFTNVKEKRCKKCCGDSNIRADQWKCGKCSVIHGYGDKVCNTCDASRIASGLWSCETCSIENKCLDKKCGVCGTNNDYLSAKYCDKCKINKVTHNNQYCNDCEKYNNEKYKPKQWKCQYPSCNEYNYHTEAYCSVCRLERSYSLARGDNVKLWYDNEEKIIWICHKCFKINKSHELVCYGCRETRYERKYCHKCRICNDGTTNNCEQCYEKL